MKFGRKPRHYDPRIQKLKHIGLMPTAPASVDWTKGQTSFGMMLNDQLGDCTCAAIYHARQIWTSNAGVESTEGDTDVLSLYENACGYDPSNPNTDQGGSEQAVLNYILRSGMPIDSNPNVDKIAAYVEVDQSNLNEVKVTINEFGVAYIGIQIPQSIYDPQGNVQGVWDFVDANSAILGGHAVVLVGYDADGFSFISWGSLYKMTWSFFQTYCDEAYAIADKDWINSLGKTPLGLTLAQLESMMNGLRG